MTRDQLQLAKDLIRWTGRGLRREYDAVSGLLEACSNATVDGSLPAQVLAPALAALYAVTEDLGFGDSQLRVRFPGVLQQLERFEKENGALLTSLAERAKQPGLNDRPPILLGDVSLALTLFRTLRALPARFCVVGSPAGVDGSAVDHFLMSAGDSCIAGSEGRFAELQADAWREVGAGDCLWRVPRPELQAMLWAARVGEPESPPTVPAWVYLGIVLKGCKGEMDTHAVLRLAEQLGLSEAVQRGLVIEAILFPELKREPFMKHLDVPAWEMLFATPIAARKLVAVSLERATAVEV